MFRARSRLLTGLELLLLLCVPLHQLLGLLLVTLFHLLLAGFVDILLG